jgi:hypothetical protein
MEKKLKEMLKEHAAKPASKATKGCVRAAKSTLT